MWVYGDRSRRVKPRQALRALTATLRDVESATSGPERHDRLTAAFLQAGELAQGIADAEFQAKGEDDVSPAQYEAWSEWLRRRAPETAVPGFEDFKAIAYRHLKLRA